MSEKEDYIPEQKPQTPKKVQSLKEALPIYQAATQDLLKDPAIRRSHVPEHLLGEYDRIHKTPPSPAEPIK